MGIDWEAIGAIGEIVGAVAVIATLIYLARQMQQNNKLLRTQARNTFLQNRETALQSLYQSDGLMLSILKARDNEESSALERQRLDIYYRSVFVLWDWEYAQYDDGLLDESPVTRFRDAAEYYPLLKESWSNHKATLSPKFAQFLESHVLN